MQNIKQIKITEETYNKLSEYGKFRDSFDTVLQRVLHQLETNQKVINKP